MFLLGFLFWCSLAPFFLFYSWYLKLKGASYVEIGTILSLGTILSFIAQLASGVVLNKLKNLKLIFISIFLTRLIFSSLIVLSKNYYDTYIWYLLFSFFMGLFLPTSQYIVSRISCSKELGTNLGKFRLSGSAGWVFSCLISGILASYELEYSFLLVPLFSGISLLLSFLIPSELKGETKPNYKKVEEAMKSNLKDYISFSPFLLSIFISSIAMGSANNFLNLFLMERWSSPFYLASILALGAFFEIPSMFMSGKLSDLFGPIKVLLLSQIMLAFVYLSYASVSSIGSYFLVQAIRGIFYSAFTISGMHYSSSIKEESKRSILIGLYNAFSTVGLAIGPFIGGIVSQYLSFFGFSGIASAFVFSSLLSALSSLLLLFTKK